MKTVKTIAPIILLLTLILTGCCKKAPNAPTTDADGLPIATQTGANTFGCLIDGVPFTVSGQYSDWRYYGVEYSFGGDSVIYINIKAINPDKNVVILSKVNGILPGTFLANKFVKASHSFANLGGSVIPGQGGYYVANDSLAFNVTITKYTGDRTKYCQTGDIVAGFFEGEMQNNQGTKIKITKGRFDIARK